MVIRLQGVYCNYFPHLREPVISGFSSEAARVQAAYMCASIFRSPVFLELNLRLTLPVRVSLSALLILYSRK